MSYLNAIIFLYSLIMENVMHSTTEGCENNKVHCGTGHVARDILSNRLKLGYTSNNLLFYPQWLLCWRRNIYWMPWTYEFVLLTFTHFFSRVVTVGIAICHFCLFFLFTLYTRMHCLALPLTCIFDRSFW